MDQQGELPKGIPENDDWRYRYPISSHVSIFHPTNSSRIQNVLPGELPGRNMKTQPMTIKFQPYLGRMAL